MWARELKDLIWALFLFDLMDEWSSPEKATGEPFNSFSGEPEDGFQGEMEFCEQEADLSFFEV